VRDPVPALIKQLEWCEEDCRSIIDALARAGDPAALEPLSAKLADPVLADSAAGAIATIAARADSRGRAIKLLERGLDDADPASRGAIEASIAGLRR
jgi:HEAT repeat protein